MVNGDYFYCVISDGAGSSDFAKEAAWCTVNTAADFCYNNGNAFFTDSREQISRNMVFDIQQVLYEQAKKLNSDLSQMMSTLVLLCIDTKSMQYTTVHIGDGLIAKYNNTQFKVLSYPHNGKTNSFTYFICDENITENIRISNKTFNIYDSFIICSDGAYEKTDNVSNIPMLYDKADKQIGVNDDITYCIFNIQIL